jgi:hypothetical protein
MPIPRKTRMKKAPRKAAEKSTQAAPDAVELGRWLGRREAFSLIAGRCSGAEIESLRRIRDERLYLAASSSWDKFCTTHVGASRRNVERSIRLLEEFGPAYFQVTQMARIGAEEYRAIAGHVDADGVRLDGSVVALLPENSGRVAAAVGELLRRAEPGATVSKAEGFDQVIKRCETAARLLDESPGELDPGQQVELASILWRMRQSAAARGVVVVSW